MPLTHTRDLFAKALKGKYALGAFNVNNMELIQAIVEACEEEKAPLILQISKGARQYANPVYLKKLIEAAINRDYPVMFGTLYIFTLIGLLLNIVSDISYTLVDPRIDFEGR